MRILLVAGHGNGDPGACANGYTESTLTREFVAALYSQLSQYAQVDVFDTSKNMYTYLKNGGTFDFSPYGYTLELHFNAGGGTGTEILVHANQQGVSVEQKIVNNISALGFKNRGIKRRSDLGNMNRIYNKGKDYALLEVCFIDSAADMKLYSNNISDIAKAVTQGIVDGFGISPTQNATTELVTPNDIVWELAQRIKIDNVGKAVSDLEIAKKENSSCYWMLRKIANNK